MLFIFHQLGTDPLLVNLIGYNVMIDIPISLGFVRIIIMGCFNVVVISQIVLQVDIQAVQLTAQSLIGIQKAVQPILDQADTVLHIHRVLNALLKHGLHRIQRNVTGACRSVLECLVQFRRSSIYVGTAAVVEIHTDIDRFTVGIKF